MSDHYTHRFVTNKQRTHRVCEACGVNQEKQGGKWKTTYDPQRDPWCPALKDDVKEKTS